MTVSQRHIGHIATRALACAPSSTSMDHDIELAIAVRQVAEAKRIVDTQRQRIAELKAVGWSTLDHEERLRTFLRMLSVLETRERILRQDVRLPQSD